MRLSSVILVLGSALVSTACGSTRPNACELPETSPLVIEASDRLNPDGSGRSLPTIIRVYQLRDVGALEQASFEDVWHDASGTLGESLLVQDEITIYPRQTVRRQLDRDPDANFIVGVGIFRRPVGTTWRTVLALPAPRSQAQCAAQTAEGDPPPPPPIPHVHLFAEDFHIEGTLELEAVTSGSECASGDPLCAAAADAAPEAPEAPEAPQPEAPQAPQASVPASKAIAPKAIATKGGRW